ncbi:MAG: alpha/beta hydrolase [Rhodospirillaceae bacterium]|jgi:pimeloyl-ACP methyl ester carboxylesterase|nr:alpha/beta hydrolase [Rhodospirillaceae bacterium]MBT5677584.1 alpha/beta hydrolase [Rhodospirillaceae bacterium]
MGGLMSDMSGSKALALEVHCRAVGRAFVRFDYTGHGESSGQFTDGTIGRWHADSLAILDGIAAGRQILVGSSMGGWQMLLAARARPGRIAGMIGIAAAPDFTEDLMWQQFDAAAKAKIRAEGILHLPSDYEDMPYPVTLGLIEDGRDHLLLRSPLEIPCPIHLIHGMADKDVPWQTALNIAEAVTSEEVSVTLVKGGGHRLSEEADLTRLTAAVESMAARVHGG